MFIRKLCMVIGLVLAFGFFFEIVAHAQDTSQEMTVRLSLPIQTPGQLVPAGTYRYKPTELLLKTLASPESSSLTLRSYQRLCKLLQPNGRTVTKTW